MATVPQLLLRVAAVLTPSSQRSEWLREWNSELTYLQRRGGSRSFATAFCMGAFRDAWILRWEALRLSLRRERRAGLSPAACLAVLSAQAVVAALIWWASPAVQASVWDHSVEAHVLIAVGALLLAPLSPGAERLQIEGLRSWCFLAAKMAVLSVTVYFASFDIVPVISRAPLQPQLTFVLYIVAWRWAIRDQRRRCPVCLGVLTNPVRIGHPGGTLLDWYGSEFVCLKGHGVLYEPEFSSRSHCFRRWVNLDPSWRELFSGFRGPV